MRLPATREFETFHEMVSVLAANTPHALVQDWWARLEGQIRRICIRLGAHARTSVATQIDTYLVPALGLSTEIVAELHTMRQLRNQCAHGEAPSISRDEASTFAHRAWAMAWGITETFDRLSSNNLFERTHD